MTKTLLIVAALAAFAPAAARACAGCDEDNAEHAHGKAVPGKTAAAPAPVPPGATRLTIPVSGMHCDHCASRVKAALAQVPGVKAADADLTRKQAVVDVEKGKVDTAQLVQAIDALGFKAGTPTAQD
jgi:copper chaperone CopZ